MKRWLSNLLVFMLVISMVCGCANATGGGSSDEKSTAEEDTGDASKDDPKNGDDIGDKELLVISFGTSYNDSRVATIGAIEEALEEAYEDYSIRRAFTSQIVIDHIKDRDGEEIDNVKEALDRAAGNNVKELIVQPTHLMNGHEYEDVENELAEYADSFDKVSIGAPLLTSEEDFNDVAEEMIAATKDYDDGDTAICFMGHGTDADSNSVYAKMQEVLSDRGMENYYIGTVEAKPDIDDLVAAVKEKDYKRVVLRDMMVVAGDHANNDMAGDEEDSWKSRFEKEGYEVETVLEGLGQIPGIQQIYVRHAQAAIGEATDKVADASEMTKVDDVVDEGMKPVFPESVKKGTYDIKMRSSSSMFKVDSAKLTANGETFTVKLYMTSKAYKYMYAGTAAEAAGAIGEDGYIPKTEASGDSYFFELPVTALDYPVECAAYSVNKEKWYNRTLLFESSSLPWDAYIESRGTNVADLDIENGTYNVDVKLSGGSGKASVTSPAKIEIRDGQATARIEWSSPNYDYMMVDGVKYEPVNTEGNSVFEILVTGFDYPMPVQADTTAMSKPHLIDYTLTFDSKSLAK